MQPDTTEYFESLCKFQRKYPYKRYGYEFKLSFITLFIPLNITFLFFFSKDFIYFIRHTWKKAKSVEYIVILITFFLNIILTLSIVAKYYIPSNGRKETQKKRQ